MTTYTPIESVTLTSPINSHTFSNIPSGYDDLVIVVEFGISANSDATRVRFNGDTGSNYSASWVTGTGSSAVSSRDSNQTSFRAFGASVGPSTGSIQTGRISVFGYGRTAAFKTSLVEYAGAANEVMRLVSMWRSTAAITSITLFNVSGSLFSAGSMISLYGIKSQSLLPSSILATGGDSVYADATHRYHVFNTSGSLVVTQAGYAEYLVVGGGGGGGGWVSGSHTGGGGGAGELKESNTTLTAGTYTITVGGGGAAGSGSTRGSNGVTSSLGSVASSVGGGGGGTTGGTAAGLSGGSGGGGGGVSGGAGGAATASGGGFGNAGGTGHSGLSSPFRAGGGGGASAAGGGGTASGAGGAGRSVFGTVYAGGGGGGAGGVGGSGGGGGGSPTTAGTANTGGGGGGGEASPGNGAAGGSGIVIVRYPI